MRPVDLDAVDRFLCVTQGEWSQDYTQTQDQNSCDALAHEQPLTDRQSRLSNVPIHERRSLVNEFDTLGPMASGERQ